VTDPHDQAFPLKPGALWRSVWLGTLAGVFLTASIDWLSGKPFSFRTTAGVVAGAAAGCVFLYFFACTRANAERLLITDSRGIRRRLRWPDIAEVVFTRRWGFPQWRITSAAGKAHWLSRETKNLRGLYELARQHGGPDHPLVKALERPVYEHD
jgi:hypothetical protein